MVIVSKQQQRAAKYKKKFKASTNPQKKQEKQKQAAVKRKVNSTGFFQFHFDNCPSTWPRRKLDLGPDYRFALCQRVINLCHVVSHCQKNAKQLTHVICTVITVSTLLLLFSFCRAAVGEQRRRSSSSNNNNSCRCGCCMNW